MGDTNNVQLTESLQSLIELTSRIDERVKMMAERYAENDLRLERLMESTNILLTRVSIIESENISNMKKDINELNRRVDSLETTINPTTQAGFEALEEELASIQSKSDNKWAKLFDFFVKLLWVIVAAYLLYKFGLQAPP